VLLSQTNGSRWRAPGSLPNVLTLADNEADDQSPPGDPSSATGALGAGGGGTECGAHPHTADGHHGQGELDGELVRCARHAESLTRRDGHPGPREAKSSVDLLTGPGDQSLGSSAQGGLNNPIGTTPWPVTPLQPFTGIACTTSTASTAHTNLSAQASFTQ